MLRHPERRRLGNEDVREEYIRAGTGYAGGEAADLAMARACGRNMSNLNIVDHQKNAVVARGM